MMAQAFFGMVSSNPLFPVHLMYGVQKVKVTIGKKKLLLKQKMQRSSKTFLKSMVLITSSMTNHCFLLLQAQKLFNTIVLIIFSLMHSFSLLKKNGVVFLSIKYIIKRQFKISYGQQQIFQTLDRL